MTDASTVDKPQAVLIDMDGTIVDSAPSILACVRLAMAELGLPPVPPERERGLIGPPFRESFPPFVGADRVEEFIGVYRRHYVAEDGMLATTAFDGMPHVLAAVAEGGTPMVVATSKVDTYAVRILAHLGLENLFQAVCGDDPSGARGTKALVVGEALRRLGNPDPKSVVMIGDRHHDVEGAREHGVATVGVRWGYAGPGELETAGARQIVDRPADLLAALGLAA